MGKQGRRWALAGLTGLAFVLRVVGLATQSLWRDEVDAIRFASQAPGELLRAFATPGYNGPLYYVLLRPWLGVAGNSEFALRFFSLFFGVLSVPLVYRLARRLFPPRPGLALLAALLAAVSPYLVWYSQEGKMYALVVALVLLSMEGYLAALEEGGWRRWLVYVLATSLAFYVHLIAALVVPVQVLCFFLVNRRVRATRWKPWLASLAALTLPYLPLLAWQVPLLLQPAQTGYRFVPLPEMLYSLLVSYSLGVVWGGTLPILALFLGLLLAAGLLWKAAGLPPARLLMLACWLLLPILLFFLLTLSRPLYTARYLIFILPAYLLLVAVGVAAVSARSRLLAGLVLLALLAASGWGLWTQARTPLKTDFRAATHYLAARLAPGDLVLFQIPYGRYSFEYYYQPQPGPSPAGEGWRVFLPRVAGGGGQPYRWADGLYTNSGMTPDEVDQHMAALTAGRRVVWMVATEVSLWDERGLVQAWLDSHASRAAEAEFVRVAVYRYELP
jgi:mannosyltransferase